jgi:3,4-dihydroxy 2-butanone 4-phosphate synthase
VTTGVSADRVTTVRAAIADGAKPSDLNRPGHVFRCVRSRAAY